MQKDIKRFEAAGIRIVGISYDSVDVLKGFATKRQISFPLLSDPESKVIAAFHIRNNEMNGKKFGNTSLDGVPHPGTFVVDQKGIVRAKLFLNGYRERHSNEELLKVVEKLK